MRRKLIAGSLAAMTLLSVPVYASGAEGGESKYQTTYGSKQFDGVTISVELFDRSNAPEGSTILENRWTKYAQDAMAEVGINLEFVAVPRGDEVSKMQTMVGSGTAPTITLTYTYTYARDYYKDGGIWDLSEFVDGEDQAQNLKKYVGDSCLELGRNSDGSLIGIVARRATTANSNIFIRKDWLDDLGLEVPTTTDELEQVLIQFRDHADDLKQEFSIEGDVIPMSFIINNGDQDPSILINGFGDGYGDTGDHFAVTDEGKVIYTTVQEGYKEGIKWLHKLVTENLIDPEAFTQEWSTYVAKGKNHRYGLCFTWDIANIDNNTDYVMLPALTGPDGMRNITRQNNSETSGFDRGRCVLTTSCRNTALAAAWIDQMYAPLQSPQNNWGTYGEKDSFNIFELSVNKDGEKMLKHMDLGDQSPVEVREAQSVNGPLAILNEYYDVYVTQPEDAKWRLDNMHETYLQDMNSKYVYPNVFMSIDDTNKVSQYDTDIKKYAEQKKADWILNGGIDEEWDSYLKKMEKYGLSDYLSIKQKYFDQYQDSLSSEK